MINWFYKHAHPFYKLFYFIYKEISDRKEISWTKNYLKKGMTVIDIGSNIGFYTLLFSKLVGSKGAVYSFEPDETNFSILKKNCQGRKNIKLFNLAVGDKNGKIKLYLSNKLNVDHRSYETDEKRVVKVVKVVSLDNIFINKKIDLIKIDIQGYDYFALRGAEKLIKKQKKNAIIGEFWPYGLESAGVNPNEYLVFLKKIGYKITLKKKVSQREHSKKYYTNFIALK